MFSILDVERWEKGDGKHLVGDSAYLIPCFFSSIMLPFCSYFFFFSLFLSVVGLCERNVMIYRGTLNSQQLVFLVLPSSYNKTAHQNLNMETSRERDCEICASVCNVYLHRSSLVSLSCHLFLLVKMH